MKIDNYKLFVIPGARPSPEFTSIYELAYALWERVWTQTFRELDNADRLFSDDFTRQDEILCLFNRDVCIALVCHRYANFSVTSTSEDSYFRAWPQDAIHQLVSHGPMVVIGSQITVHPEYRKSAHNGGAKNLITYLSMRCLCEVPVDAISGTMRSDKGMNHLFYQCGAFPLKTNINFHNVPVDLVAFFPRKRPLRIESEIQDIIEKLWLARGEDPQIATLHIELMAASARMAG